ncbi:type II toxin-antitoxin system HipA family toxin [Hydrogenophaga sp. BPS33]|uniref:type II toxin-antitoxin system HipA family toxin n=1 Tax=Hydrogenophaga sp. BPS33 TaxID=2651974 RepID=UPI00132022D3|nr:HipA domain-containing protein [Hydrogenophaga sp. BPS33]QHE84968.1 type II toxin-antitoxin system HipA family toxin [Hydrogenophaga sp. BPS33]
MATKNARTSRPLLEVHLDAPELGAAAHIGKLYPAAERLDLAPSFAYTQAWLDRPGATSIDPRLALVAGEQHSPDGRGFGIFSDCAPDRWGRVLMERREANAALQEKRPMARMNELFYLLGVHDLTRAGALRFRRGPGAPFLDNSHLPAPPATDLRAMAEVARQLDGPRPEAMPEYEQWLAMLIASGTSLGGARPKASFTMPDGTLWLAKFPGHYDTYDWGSWEYLTYLLAIDAGINMPPADRERLSDRYHTYRVSRFDRLAVAPGGGQGRRMVASAMTLLERHDGQTGGSYLDIVEAIENLGGSGLTEDLEQLFRRAVFNLLVGNRDDHLRNHGFLLTPSGWRLAPAFDINPNPAKSEHALTWDGRSAAPHMPTLLATAPYYRLSADAAQAIVEQITTVVSTWRERATQLDLSRVEVQVMARVFAA